MRARAAAVTLLVVAAACHRAPAPPAPSGGQAVVLVSIDGFRPDYLDSIQPPHLLELARSGVRARWMQPATPTLTFPNHYTIVTGLYPEHHGVVNNHFRDPATGVMFHYTDSNRVRESLWWGGEPLWVTAEKQGVRAGSYFWVGSEASIKHVRPTFWKKYDDHFPAAGRVDSVLSWLTRADSLRVRLALLYFSGVDHMAHDSGPWSPDTRAAVMGVDSAIGRLMGGIQALGLADRVNVIIVSDHGMLPTNRERVVILDDYVNPDDYVDESIYPFLAFRPRNNDVGGALADLRRVPHLRVYRATNTPGYWHYSGNPRIPPIVGVWDDGWIGASRDFFRRRPPREHGGEHGYDQSSVGMHATFLALGPAFRQGLVAEPFQNIHVYDLVCAILGLRPAPNDGSLDSLRYILR